jgi:DNA-binding NarL/FixJ family response regulator
MTEKKQPIRILIADDQMLMRQGLGELLAMNLDIEVVATASDGVEALDLIIRHRPAVALLDVRMPGMTGVEVLREVRRLELDVATLMLTTFHDDKAMIESLCSGAKGYLLKDTSAETLADAIRMLAAGESYLLPAITERICAGLARFPQQFESASAAISLTEREREVLRLVGTGLTNKEIGNALGCAEGTIRNHMSAVLSKLGVRDRTQALLRALDQGMI